MDSLGMHQAGFSDQPFHRGEDNGVGLQNHANRNVQQAAMTIGAFDEPTTRENQTGIPIPTIEATDFEIKPSLINMVKENKYNGLEFEDPLDHLYQFERMCRTVRMNGVSDEAVKMILFPFSLGGKANQWEKRVSSTSVSTWEGCKKVFLMKFYPRQKTAKYRNDIMNFQQGDHESFSDAWDRLKEYTRSCPHHGFSREHLLGIFYRGVYGRYRRELDIASFGTFASLTAAQGERLIENLSQSYASYEDDFDETSRDPVREAKGLHELEEKLENLSNFLLAKQISFVGELEGSQQGYQDRGFILVKRFDKRLIIWDIKRAIKVVTKNMSQGNTMANFNTVKEFLQTRVPMISK